MRRMTEYSMFAGKNEARTIQGRVSCLAEVDAALILKDVPSPRLPPLLRRSKQILGLNLALPDDCHARSCYAGMMWPQRLGDALRPVPGVLRE